MNVLFIVVDDLRPELGCYGVQRVISPNIDRLAEKGLVFKHAYCQQAICAPSRCSVLSGCRPDTTKIYDLDVPLRKSMPDVVTLPQQFKMNGYETVSIGKVYHHPKDDLEGWSKEPFQSKGDWKGRGYLTDEAIEAFMNREDPYKASRGLGPAFEAADVPDNAYHDGMEAEAAIKELNRLKSLDKPFFLALGFHKTHLPFNAPKKYWDMYEPEKIPLADNPFPPEGANQFTLTSYGELKNYFGIPQEGSIPEDLARKLVHGYLACVTYMDAQLGKVLDELEKLDLSKDTAIVFWGDHGWKLGEHDSWCKHSNMEIDTNAPLIISTPNMKEKGRYTDALVEFIDMYPTLCDICGLSVPEHLEGRSLKPLLDNFTLPWSEAAYSQYPRGNKSVMGYTVKTRDYRYTRWIENRTGKILAEELYDHRTDIKENRNVAGKALTPELKSYFSNLLKKIGVK